MLRLTRHSAEAGASDAIKWDPTRGMLDPASLESADAIIHLGASRSMRGGPRRKVRDHDQPRREYRTARTGSGARSAGVGDVHCRVGGRRVR